MAIMAKVNELKPTQVYLFAAELCRYYTKVTHGIFHDKGQNSKINENEP